MSAELVGWGWAPKEYLPGLWIRYKITQTEFDAIWAAQEGLCAGCKGVLAHPLRKEGKLGLKFDVDHKHIADKACKTQDVRGFLCRPCNIFLGKVRDNSNTLRNLSDYLRRHGETL